MPTSFVSRKDVVEFLFRMKKTLSRNDSFKFVPREKNLKTLADLGYTIKDVKRELFRLSVQNYVKGPEPDDNPKFSGSVWVFGTNVAEINLYLKLKLTCSDKKYVLCLSFHEAEWPQKFPFKE